MAQYLLLLHEPQGGFSGIAPQEMQTIIQKYQAWSGRMRESGKLLDGKKLKDDGGKRLRKNGDRLLVDGPFSEAKEVIGGFFLIQADDYEEAVALCGDCPHLAYGSIELREIDPV